MDLVPDRSGTVHENWLAERGEQFAPVSRSRRWIPSRDSKNAVDDQLQDATSVLDAFHIVKLAGDAPGEVCRPRLARHDRSPRTHRRPPLPRSAIFWAPHTRKLTSRQKERLREAFVADEAHISVDVAYLHRASVRGLPPSHTRPRPTPGRTPHRAPTSLSHPLNRLPGPDPTQVEGRTRRLLRHRRSQQRAHRSHQRTLSSWADESPEATATPPTTNSECSSSQEV